MKAVGYTQPGDASVFQWLDLPEPALQSHDLLVRVEAVSVNPTDFKARASQTSTDATPTVLGFDAAGTVVRVGREATRFREGDAVFYAGSMIRQGSNAELQAVDARIVGHKPQSLSWTKAAALPLTALTAWELLFDRMRVPYGPKAGEGTLLIINGAGGVGSMLTQIARRLTGLTVVATASRPETVDWCRRMGAHHVVDHHKPLDGELKLIGIEQVEYVAGLTKTRAHADALATLIAPQGTVALIDDALDIAPFKTKSVTVAWELMYTRSLFETPDVARQGLILDEIAALVDAGLIVSTATATLGALTPDTLREAHERSEGGTVIGKIVLPGIQARDGDVTDAAPAAQTLEPVFSSSLVVNGATTSPDGRLFLPAQPAAPGATPQVVEVRDGKAVAYPDEHWNGWTPGIDGYDRFVGVNAIRVGPDGALWIVDRGSPGIGKPAVAGGFKLVRIDIAANRVDRVIDLAAVSRPWTFIDDVRFNGPNAYLTDAGAPGLIVLDIASGKARRVLEGHPSTVAQSRLTAEGEPLRTATGEPVNIHADQLEVSPDGAWFYFQPCSGGLSRIATRYLDDPSLGDTDLAGHVEPFADTPSTGGTAIDEQGTIYLSDVDRKRIITISPEGEIATLFADPRLIWVDAMWIDDHGDLLLPAAQLNRTAGLNGGRDTVEQPITLYRYPIGRKGLRR